MLYENLEKLVYSDKIKLIFPTTCNNTLCLEYIKKKKKFGLDVVNELSEVNICITQIRAGYCEAVLRCPYCSNLLASFGIQGLDLKSNLGEIKKVNWAFLIMDVRKRWEHFDFKKPIFEWYNIILSSQKMVLTTKEV